jgi:tRNA (cytidine/uridine-2'-O-)-methyltransferase
MLHIILLHPEIPPNTGNVIRLCANTGAALHLVRPLGFTLDDARLRRAGLDYHEYASVAVHDDLDQCIAAIGTPRVFAFSARGTRRHTDAQFVDGDALPPTQCLCLPMAPHNRSLNLSNAVAVAVYEAWRQLGFVGAATIA